MGTFRLNADVIKLITAVESMTGATVVDCVEEAGVMGFVVQKGDVGLAVGKKGANVERLRRSLGKNVWVIEYSDSPDEFMRNIFHPAEIRGIVIGKSPEGNVATIEVKRSERSKVIGQEGMKIKLAKKIVKRHCDIDDISVKVVN